MPVSRSGKCLWMKRAGKWFKFKCYRTVKAAKIGYAHYKRKYVGH